jgi:hypothetical protein
MTTRSALTLLVAALGAAVAGCGTTERSGAVGDTLDAKGLEVTVEQVDTSVPVPKNDITGLSQPTPGSGLVAAKVHVCSDQDGALGPLFEIPEGSEPDRVTFGFDDTGSAQPGSNNEVSARFSWTVAG